MSEVYEIRRATPADVDTLVALRYAMVRELAGQIDRDEALGNPREYFEGAVPSGDYVCFLAEARGPGGRNRGIGNLSKTTAPAKAVRRPRLHLEYALLCREWRGKGIASSILKRLVGYARELGADDLSLSASDQRPAGIQEVWFR